MKEETETLETIRTELARNEMLNKCDVLKVNFNLSESPSNKGSNFGPLMQDLDEVIRSILRQMAVRLVMSTVWRIEPESRLRHGTDASKKFRQSPDLTRRGSLSSLNKMTINTENPQTDDNTSHGVGQSNDSKRKVDECFRKDYRMDDRRLDDKYNGDDN